MSKAKVSQFIHNLFYIVDFCYYIKFNCSWFLRNPQTNLIYLLYNINNIIKININYCIVNNISTRDYKIVTRGFPKIIIGDP